MEADQIRALRQRLNLSPTELGQRLGVSQSTVARWEQAEEFPTRTNAERLRELAEQEAPGDRENTPSKADEARLWAPFLGDPSFAATLRKLLYHPKLRSQVAELARDFPDPADS